MRRKPNPEQRRRELCDAAIRLLAEDGLKGVSHLKVDQKAGVPDGTTSFYFRTRSALVRAVAARVAELDRRELTAATRAPAESEDSGDQSPSGLAQLVVRATTGARLTRTKARAELALEATRDPVLDDAFRGYTEGFLAIIKDAVERAQPGRGTPDPALVDEQAYIVTMYLSGLMLSFATGVRRTCTAEDVDRAISAIVGGVHTTFGADGFGTTTAARPSKLDSGRRRSSSSPKKARSGTR